MVWQPWDAGLRQTLESLLPSLVAVNKPPGVSKILFPHWLKEAN